MKNVRSISTFALLLLVFFAVAAPAHADPVNVSAVLILGTNDGEGVDGALGRYEQNLKRVFPFDTFKLQGQASGKIDSPGASRIALGNGHTLELSSSEANGDKVRLAARWTQGDRTLINTTVVASKGNPTILGGPSQGSGKLILLLVAR